MDSGYALDIPANILIDTDAAADDMIALLLALKANTVTINAITVVSGACSARQGVQNVLHLLELTGVSVPVYEGRQSPMFGPLRDSTHIMGSDGLGDIGLQLNGRTPSVGLACDAIRDYIKSYPRKNTIVCLGPLTNLGIALLADPSLVPLIGRLVIMGGVSDGVGNITPAAEFNFWADPEAARIVFESGVVCELVGWDLSRSESCRFSPKDLDSIREIGTPLAHYSVDILSGLRRFLQNTVGTEYCDLPDPITMAIALNKDIAINWDFQHVTIDDSNGISRGASIIDRLNVGKKQGNAKIALSAKKSVILDMLKDAVSGQISTLN